MEEKEGIPPAQQRLIYSGKAMFVLSSIRSLLCLVGGQEELTSPCPFGTCRVDTNTIKSYGIQSGNVIHLVLAVSSPLTSSYLAYLFRWRNKQ
jgi:hypothetical protein